MLCSEPLINSPPKIKDCKVNVQSGALNLASQTFSDLRLSNELQDQIAANEISVSPTHHFQAGSAELLIRPPSRRDTTADGGHRENISRTFKNPKWQTSKAGKQMCCANTGAAPVQQLLC